MMLFFLLHVGFVPDVTWTSIMESLEKLREDKEAGTDQFELIERRQNIRLNIRRMFIRFDDDVENFLANRLKECVQIHLNWQFILGILSMFMVFLVLVITLELSKEKMLSDVAEDILLIFAFGTFCFSRHSLESEDGFIRNCTYSFKEDTVFPEWFESYFEAREEFPDLATPITPSSHPYLFLFLQSIYE